MKQNALNRAASSTKPLTIKQSDWQKKIKAGSGYNLIVLAVDASDSMGTQNRMSAAKGAALALLSSAYKNRNRVAIVAFGGEEAAVILPVTRSIELAREHTRKLSIGGATPMAGGLLKALAIIRNQQTIKPDLEARLVLISDGEANVPLNRLAGIMPEIEKIGTLFRQCPVHSILVDTARPGPRNPMLKIAGYLGGAYKNIQELTPSRIVDFVL